ncbi:chromosome segregation ATPase [Psychrosphaera saromensis]|nr:DUF4041 domain-containing protein [Psychrosphaera saromensis]GHB73184.1 chromosome segregation ATPase [Psychrosphaera saromensis]GLQ13469.1 chromosome segregation ATPase [Psychrosphaera saromensis]
MFSLNPATYKLALIFAVIFLIIITIIVFRLRKNIGLLKSNLLTEIKVKSQLQNKVQEFEDKYSDVFDREKTITSLDQEIAKKNNDINSLRSSYQQKKKIFDNLMAEAAIYDETIELADLGFYKPSFSFDHSEIYKEKINEIKAEQKIMVGDKAAITCTTEWSVEGSKVKGRTMTNRNIRMTARAFNNECDAAIGKVKWNNAQRMIERIHKAFDAINKLNESNMIFINDEYLDLKISELKLTHEYHEKRQQEKEEQAEIRQQMREESRLEKDMEEALKEEGKFQTLLDKATKQAQKSTGDKLSKLEEQIAKLHNELAEAHEKSERAKSMAEQTKAGHVYVISNVGSFGENVYKIGMTRRLEPLDRVKELGDASVPFLFDVHAMIYTENAPDLEKSLHNEFNDRRLNLVNSRKEFFDVELLEIEKVVKDKHGDAEFYITAEARQYNESRAIRANREEAMSQVIEFPEEI